MKPFLILAGLIAVAPLCDNTVVSAETLRAGCARVDITPEQPVTLAGYGSRKALSEGVHDRLSARAVAFEQGGTRLVLVSTDILGFYGGTAESARTAILEECGLKPSELFLCAIHTHSAPTPALDGLRGHSNNVAYTRELQLRLVKVTRQALARLAPAKLGFGSGSSPVGVNRREVVQREGGASAIVLGRNPGGPCDPEVQVLKIMSAEANAEADNPATVLFAYATHSTSLGPGNLIVSGDVHGLAEQFVENQFGRNAVAPGFAGASGDIDPWFRVLPGFKTTNGWIPEPVLLGTMLGEEIVQVAKRTTVAPVEGPIRTAIKALELPRKSAGDSSPATAEMNVTVACLGDVAFVGWGGEIFSQIGKAIKAESPFRHTFIFTHCNGAAGYLPTGASYSAGGYEVQSSSFQAGADEQLMRETLAMLRDLKSDLKSANK